MKSTLVTWISPPSNSTAVSNSTAAQRPKTRFALGAAVAFMLIGILALLSTPASADVDDFTFDSMSADYHLTRDETGTAHLDVTETIVAVFPEQDQNRGIVRRLPLDYDGVPLEPLIASVTDESGAPIVYQTSESGDWLEIALGTDEYVHGRQTYVIHYTMVNTARHFQNTDTDEFYWDVNGDTWAQSFGRVSATLTVDPEIVPALNGESACYQGSNRSTDRCVISVSDEAGSEAAQQATVFTASTASALQPEQTMTIAIGFASGTFVIPEAPSRAWWTTWLPLVLATASIGLTVALLTTRLRRWRDAPGRGVIVPEYLPPKGISIVAGSDLVKQQKHWFSAAVVDMAVRGVVRLVDVEQTGAFGRKKHGFAVEMVEASRMQPPDAQVLGVLVPGFGLQPGQRVLIDDSPNAERAEHAAALVQQTRAELLRVGLRSKPPMGLPKALRAAAWSALAVAALYTLWALAQAGEITWWIGISGLLTGWSLVILLLTLPKPKVLTEDGARARDEVVGLKMYMDLAERERFALLQSVQGAQRVDLTDGSQSVRLNERLLPWAVLWGVESSWAQQLQIDYERAGQQPVWYQSTTPFTAGVLASRLASFNVAATASAQAPPSSGGSFSGGAGGGGFAGGGGGGGGGGGR